MANFDWIREDEPIETETVTRIIPGKPAMTLDDAIEIAVTQDTMTDYRARNMVFGLLWTINQYSIEQLRAMNNELANYLANMIEINGAATQDSTYNIRV